MDDSSDKMLTLLMFEIHIQKQYTMDRAKIPAIFDGKQNGRAVFQLSRLVFLLFIFSRVGGHASSASRAVFAAACSASFLLWPEPVPRGAPLSRTSATKVLLWSGPSSPTMW